MNFVFGLSFKRFEPQLISRHKLQKSGFKLQELQKILSFDGLYQISINEGRIPNDVIKNGHNPPMYMLRLSGTDPSTLQTTCSSLRFKGNL